MTKIHYVVYENGKDFSERNMSVCMYVCILISREEKESYLNGKILKLGMSEQ